MKYILALDQGTTSSRALLIDHAGKVCGQAQKQFKQMFPSPGWVEHDPIEIWSSQLSVATEVLAKSGIAAKEIGAIGITNQRETTIVWDRKTSQPIFNAIVWQDRRTTDLCQKLKNEGLEPLFKKKTGLVLDPYFSGTKIKWILDHVPGAYERARRGELAFGTVDSWLIWKLTDGKVHITDATNASRTLLYNLETGSFDDELLNILQIPKEILPQICESSGSFGSTSNSIFSHPIPICGVAGDQQAALVGQGCFDEGMVKNTYGTGCFMLMNTGKKPVFSSNNLLTTVAYKIQGTTHYALEGSVFIAGAVVQWIKENLGVIKNSSDIEKLACSVTDTHGVYFVPAFTGLGAPHWNPYARGSIFGLTRGSTSAHIARAALESIAYQVTDLIRAMEADSQLHIKELRVDGGAVVNDLLMQFQADVLQAPVLRPHVTELTALGAAFLAGLGCGFWKDRSEVRSQWRLSKAFTPSKNREKFHKMYAKWTKAIEICQEWEENNE
jgi:glycerol kinase